MGGTYFLLLILFGNAWIWRIATFDILIFILLILSTILLWLWLFKKLTGRGKLILLISFLFLAYFQWKTTSWQSLTLLDNDQQRLQQMRLGFYHPSSHYLRVLFHRLNLKNFLEGDFNTVTTRLERNFFETLDLNIYFFAGHPRQRIWASEFEKFPFIFIVPFLIGLYQLILKRNLVFYLIFCSGLILPTALGHQNGLGPFISFPILVVSIIGGLLTLWQSLKLLPEKLSRPSLVLVLVLVVTSIIQSFIYAS